MDDYLRFYETYLSEPINGQGKNRTTTCPFCEKENKFAINIQTSEAQCLSASCGEKVNHITFITKFHEAWSLHTTEDQLEELSSARGISISTLEKAGLAYDSYSDRWLVPYKNPLTPNLTNLGYFQTRGKNAYRIYKAPNINDSLPLTLYNPYQLHKAIKTDTLYIAEGEWDTLAMMDILEGKKEIVIGVPGALIFPEASRKWFDKITHINLVYDNDEAGAMGIAKAADIVQRWNKKVRVIDWSAIEEAEDGFDIRDMRIKHHDSAYESIKASLYDYEVEQAAGQELSAGYVNTVADIEEVESFDHYVDMYGQQMFLSEENIKSMAITMAIATSQYMPGESLWFFLVGQPGSGKTTLIESYGGNNEYFDYASRVTSKSLVSGWNSGPESSLITKMNGKVFFIKDFTVVLGMPNEQKKEVFNLFRDIYDGTLKITFGNGKVIDLSNLRFNMIAGVTDAIKAQNDASMGERFLRYDFMGNECDDESIIDSALAGFGQFSTRKGQLTDATLGYVKTLMRPENRWDTDNLPRLSDDSRKKLSTLARYTAYIRTRPETDRNEGLVYRPRKEVASRLALQYAKLAFALEKVFSPGIKGEGGILDISDRTCQLIAKVAHDTAEGFSQDVMQLIHQRPKISRKDLEIKLRLPQTRIHRVITDLKTLGLIQTLTLSNIRPSRDGSGKGRPSEMFKVHPDFAPLMDDVLGVKNGTTVND
jgi:hypothetical protein